MFTSVLTWGSLDWLAGISSTMYNTAIQLCIFSSGEEEISVIVKAFLHKPRSPGDPMGGAGARCHYHTGGLKPPRLPAHFAEKNAKQVMEDAMRRKDKSKRQTTPDPVHLQALIPVLNGTSTTSYTSRA